MTCFLIRSIIAQLLGGRSRLDLMQTQTVLHVVYIYEFPKAYVCHLMPYTCMYIDSIIILYCMGSDFVLLLVSAWNLNFHGDSRGNIHLTLTATVTAFVALKTSRLTNFPQQTLGNLARFLLNIWSWSSRPWCTLRPSQYRVISGNFYVNMIH